MKTVSNITRLNNLSIQGQKYEIGLNLWKMFEGKNILLLNLTTEAVDVFSSDLLTTEM